MIYFVQDSETSYIKIGFSEEPINRVRQLQTSSPGNLRLLFAMEGTMEDERELHGWFKNSKVRGEWFKPTSDILTHIIYNAVLYGYCQWQWDVPISGPLKGGVVLYLNEPEATEHEEYLKSLKAEVADYLERQSA